MDGEAQHRFAKEVCQTVTDTIEEIPSREMSHRCVACCRRCSPRACGVRPLRSSAALSSGSLLNVPNRNNRFQGRDVAHRSSNIPLPKGTSLRRNPPHLSRFRRLTRSICHRMWM
jgi:hypothetical protein